MRLNSKVKSKKDSSVWTLSFEDDFGYYLESNTDRRYVVKEDFEKEFELLPAKVFDKPTLEQVVDADVGDTIEYLGERYVIRSIKRNIKNKIKDKFIIESVNGAVKLYITRREFKEDVLKKYYNKGLLDEGYQLGVFLTRDRLNKNKFLSTNTTTTEFIKK